MLAAPALQPLGQPFPAILPVRARAEIQDAITLHRLQRLLPEVMAASEIDLWLVVCQEDNPDPLLPTLIPDKSWQPILTLLAFAGSGERWNLGMLDTRDMYEKPWQGPASGVSQWALLADLVRERDPKTIAINVGRTQWAAGGLTHNLYLQLCERLGPFAERLVSAEALVTRWAATLTPLELPYYEHAVNVGKHLIADCFSPALIEPGVTTTDDLKWHYLQRVADLGLEMSFTPYFHVVRGEPRYQGGATLMPGDAIHCDVGIKYLRYHTDHQQWLYLRRPGERGVPDELRAALARANRLQDIFLRSFEAGRTGNQLLATILERGRAAALNPKVYSHSLGYFLHQPGPLIGLPWEQSDTGGRGEVALEPYQAFTMELAVIDPLEQTGGQAFPFSVEEDVVFTPEGVRVFDQRQTEFFMV